MKGQYQAGTTFAEGLVFFKENGFYIMVLPTLTSVWLFRKLRTKNKMEALKVIITGATQCNNAWLSEK